MRCPDCNKFVPFEQQDPEVDVELIDERDQPTEGEPPPDEEQYVHVQVRARCVLACGECGTELKEADLEDDDEVIVEGHVGENHTLTCEETGIEATSRQDGKPGTPSRYRRTYYGATVNYQLTCSCGDYSHEGTVEVEEQASGFEELV